MDASALRSPCSARRARALMSAVLQLCRVGAVLSGGKPTAGAAGGPLPLELNCWLQELCNKHFLPRSERNLYFFYISNTDLPVVMWFKGQSFLCYLNYFNTNWDTQQLAGGSPSLQRPAGQNANCCSSSSCLNLRFSAASMQETVTLCQKAGCVVQEKRHLPMLLCYFCYQRSGQVPVVHHGHVKHV